MTALTLYQLATEHAALAERLTDLELDADTIRDTLEAESMALEVKATNVALIARNLEALAAQIKDAEQQMAARRKSYEARAEWLRGYLLAAMQTANLPAIVGPTLDIKRAKLPGRVIVDDPLVVPQEFYRQPPPPPPEIDKAAIRNALKAGQQVPGAYLEQGETVRIK